MGEEMLKRLLLIVLTITLLLSTTACNPSKTGDVNNALPENVASRVVKTEDGRVYIEHNGKPYLFYGTQLRIDNIRERYDADVALIDKMFAKVNVIFL